MRRELLTADARGRMSVSRLGLEPGVVVADELEDGGWVIRPGRVLTDVEAEILGRESNVTDIQRALAQSTNKAAHRRRRRAASTSHDS